MSSPNKHVLLLFACLLLTLLGCSKSPSSSDAPSASAATPALKEIALLNVSYDPTREFYSEYNQLFAVHWKQKSGQTVTVKQSHGGSGKQARAVLDGLEADVVTLALPYDVDMLAKKGRLIPKDWRSRLPNGSGPYTSTIVFMVRHGNPKGIKEWSDLVKAGVQVIAPNPETSGGARYIYLAAWGYALKQPGGTPSSAKDFVDKLYANVPVLDSGARGSTGTFAERNIGDVLVTWENEAKLTLREVGQGKIEIVVPSLSILAEPMVAVVDKVVDKHGTREVAEEYLKHLYSKEGQELAAKHFYRPSDAAVLKSHEDVFTKVTLFSVNEIFGSWDSAQSVHFGEHGVFESISTLHK